MSYVIGDYVRVAVQRQARMREVEAALRAIEPKVGFILKSERLRITEGGAYFTVPKIMLPELRKRGLNWDRSKIVQLYVTDARTHKVMFQAPVSDKIYLQWEDVYEPSPESKCQWREVNVPQAVVPQRTIYTLECDS